MQCSSTQVVKIFLSKSLLQVQSHDSLAHGSEKWVDVVASQENILVGQETSASVGFIFLKRGEHLTCKSKYKWEKKIPYSLN